MKQLGLAAALAALAHCGSSTGLVSQAVEGGPGQPIVVDIAGAESGVMPDREGYREYTVHVEVTNIENLPLTVTRITIMTDSTGAFQVQTVSRNFNEMIDPAKEHEFEMRVWGRLARPFGITEAHVVDLRVIVALSNGDSYYYTFEGPVRDMAPGMPP